MRNARTRVFASFVLLCGAVMPGLGAQSSAVASATATPPVSVGPDTSRQLRKKFWIIESHGVAGVKGTDQQFREHVERVIEWEKAGILFAAGPVTGGDAPYGMIIIRAASREEARKIADTDPLHVYKVRTYVLREWQVNEGRINVQLNFSDGSYRFD